MCDLADARAAKGRLVSRYGGRDGIVGVGLTRGEAGYSIKVNVREAAVADQLPTSVDGVEVHVAVVGRIHARD